MSKTPGFVVPSSFSSMEELEREVKRRSQSAGFSPIDFSIADGSATHSYTSTDDFLAHYGVKGMKWGGRKQRTDEEKAQRKDRLKAAAAITVVAGIQFGPEIANTSKKVLNSAVLAKQTSNGAKAAAKVFASEKGLTNYQTIQSTYNAVKDIWE